MSELPARADGELVVAAIRVLEHVGKHPPRETEIATLLRWHEDRTRVIVNSLTSHGILSVVRSAFDARYKLGDLGRMSDLPVDERAGDSIAREMADYDVRSREEAERIERMLGGRPASSSGANPTLAGLEDEFGQFRRSKPKNPFGDE
jgi:hypothetical protein